VRALLVVVDPPHFDALPCCVDGCEFVDVQTFIAKPAVKGFGQATIRGLAGTCEVQLHPLLPRPLIKPWT
jgi:hypothetical protein